MRTTLNAAKAKRVIKAAMRYHRKSLKNGYAKFARQNVNMSKERRALFDACAAMKGRT